MRASVAKFARIREILQHRQLFEAFARRFIEESSRVHSSEEGDPQFGEYLQAGLDSLLDENLRIVFEQAESPIEKIFINSLLLMFIKNDPLNLVIQPAVRNAPRQIEAFREQHSKFKEFTSWYTTKHGSLGGVDQFLHDELARGRMEEDEHNYLWRHLIFYEYFSLEDSFHLILQPGLPDINVEGKTIRPDMLLWVPADELVRIIVECDGFQYHNSKEVFVYDRKRDRALKSKGYEVLRYSGSEIHADPVAVSVDLAEYLWSKHRAIEPLGSASC